MSGLFWGLYGFIFLSEDLIKIFSFQKEKDYLNFLVGLIVIVMACIAGSGNLESIKNSKNKICNHKKLGNLLFIPALIIPIITMVGVLLLNCFSNLQKIIFLQSSSALITLFSMSLGCVLSWLVTKKLTNAKAVESI